MRERKSIVYCVRMDTKRKHNEVTSKTKYEALKELDKNRPNKEVAIKYTCYLEKKQGKNLPSFSKLITETTKSQSGNI